MPRKKTTAVETEAMTEEPKKKRGRPRKNPLTPVEEKTIKTKVNSSVEESDGPSPDLDTGNMTAEDIVRRSDLRGLVKTFYDVQNLRLRTAGRLHVKADGSAMKDNGTVMAQSDIGNEFLETSYGQIKETEEYLKKTITKLYKKCPEYQWLKDIKGIGPTIGAILITEIDIVKAVNVSKIWQYAGLNPGTTVGKKVKGKDKDGKIVLETTGELIRGDRLTAGFIAPYNKFLKTKLLGVLAGSFIKTAPDSPYTKLYYDYKNRLENSDKPCGTTGKTWKETTPGHRNNAAKRYMIKIFLQDYYAHVREIYGLPVRCPYQEEYLGHVHHSA